MKSRPLVWLCFCLLGFTPGLFAQRVDVSIASPLSPPSWAILQRELLRANSAACAEFYAKYFDERGFLLCVERWGGDDGPDDAIENCLDWPLIHAIGGDDQVLRLYKQAWEGHLRQYTLARTTEVPFARDGMYYKEFPVMMDWLHNSEGLVVFNLQGLSDPLDHDFSQRVQRFAGFYLNKDPGAPNYDPVHKVIRSMFNGSRGPLMRKATGLDWAGDPIEIENRFRPKHGETSYAQMLEHFKDYNDIVGDHPQNLKATTLALNAYMLTHNNEYRDWLLDYVDAWRSRMIANNHIIPTNIGLDGTTGGETEGKWWGGVYGWGFTVFDPASRQMAHRNQHHAGLQGFMNAYLLTGDDRYLEPWRRQVDTVNAERKMIDGTPMYPHMYGDQGWYDYRPDPYSVATQEIAWLSQSKADRARVARNAWYDFLDGKNATYPEQALRADLDRVRRQVRGMRNDSTTPDTRLADDPMEFNPASVTSLVELALGGLSPGRGGSALFCTLRYFDADSRRAGFPPDVAALIDEISADHVTVHVVNVNQLEVRRVILQGGAYAEHQFTALRTNEIDRPLNTDQITIELEPGAGARIRLALQRFVNQPTMTPPWLRERKIP